MPRVPCPAASAVDLGCCALLLVQILLRMPCPDASAADLGCCVLVACAVDLGCCVLLLAPPPLLEILPRVPCPEASAVDLGCRVLLLVLLIWARQGRLTHHAEARDRAGDPQIFSLTLCS